ncbi:hypothetical protein [Azospirillum brasilense]|uniref:hypothetical protein n=1 Tax=Azospirillum brasilense TaxID=192 RepID=UPI001EDC1943|nr:hypothetical protein [Azospirillum brasilense]
MRRSLLLPLIGLIIAISGSPATARGPALTDEEVRERIIQESIASYPGNCPCPYNTMRNGRRCGGNSAYSRPGGRSPLCFPKDVSDSMVSRYRQTH